MPLVQTCYIQIVFPPEIGVDSYLTSIEGSGIFTVADGVFLYEQLFYANRTIQLRGCDIAYGSTTNIGSIIFSYVQNPVNPDH